MTKKWRSSDFVQLRKLYKNGESMKDIAKILRSTISTVSAYISSEISFGRLQNRNKKKEVKLKLDMLMEQIRKKFNTKDQKYDQHMFSLVYWTNGYWSINIVDSWNNWFDKGIERPNLVYSTTEDACIGFLKFIEENKINIKELQER